MLPKRKLKEKLTLAVKVKPSAKQACVGKIGENSFLVCVKEKPQDGKANQAVIKALAEYLNVPKSAVILLKGHASRTKLVEINSL